MPVFSSCIYGLLARRLMASSAGASGHLRNTVLGSVESPYLMLVPTSKQTFAQLVDQILDNPPF